MSFQNTHVILPVIHVTDGQQALRNVAIARDAGCDGVFLINHESSWENLRAVFDEVVDQHFDWWIGVNCLDLLPAKVFDRFPEADGVWADNAGIFENRDAQPYATSVRLAQQDSSFKGLYFGGVAFKYQRQVQVSNLTAAAKKAAEYMDVVTTSGPKTGKSAPLDKIRAMQEALRVEVQWGAEKTPLAIASGITPDNVGDYLGLVDYFLVATGISDSFTELDEALVKELVSKVRGFEP